VQKIVPPTPTVEISLDHSCTKESTTSNATFAIVWQEHVIGPSITVRAIPHNKRHKEKKRKKKEKEEKKEKKEKHEKKREGKSEERKKRLHKEKGERRSKDSIEENQPVKDQGIEDVKY
jgi:Ni/Co efflux regulator RcnB